MPGGVYCRCGVGPLVVARFVGRRACSVVIGVLVAWVALVAVVWARSDKSGGNTALSVGLVLCGVVAALAALANGL